MCRCNLWKGAARSMLRYMLTLLVTSHYHLIWPVCLNLHWYVLLTFEGITFCSFTALYRLFCIVFAGFRSRLCHFFRGTGIPRTRTTCAFYSSTDPTMRDSYYMSEQTYRAKCHEVLLQYTDRKGQHIISWGVLTRMSVLALYNTTGMFFRSPNTSLISTGFYTRTHQAIRMHNVTYPKEKLEWRI